MHGENAPASICQRLGVTLGEGEQVNGAWEWQKCICWPGCPAWCLLVCQQARSF